MPDLQSGGCGFESEPGLLRTKVYSAFHPSGVGIIIIIIIIIIQEKINVAFSPK